MRVELNSQTNAVIQLTRKNHSVRRHPSSSDAETRNAARNTNTYGRRRMVLITKTGRSVTSGVAVRPEPDDGFLQRGLDRGLRQAEFAHRLAAVVMHAVLRHQHAFEWNARRAMRDVIRDPAIGVRERQDRQPRQLDPRGRDAGDPAEHLED